jgi:putative iron-regulated protein
MQMRGLVCGCVLGLVSAACGGGDPSTDDDAAPGATFPGEVAAAAIADHVTVVRSNYADVVAGALALQVAVEAFVAAPSAESHRAAKDAWIAARLPYGASEAFRFYDGPIDDPEDGLEGFINAWPLDENYIDYTRDEPEAGLINDVTGTPELDAEVLRGANEAQGEKAISTGYHAIEFLLWGQDDPTPGTGAGKRTHTDFLPAEQGGTASHHDRRGVYLTTVTAMLVEDLERVALAWDPGEPESFAATFGVVASDPTTEPDARKEAIGKLLRSLGSMAKAELSGERMTVAYKNRSEEDEHSCFSDNTAPDLLGNGVGIQNVWLGRYGSYDGVGLDDIVRALDPAVADTATKDIEASVSKLEALVTLQNQGTPIDVILQAEDGRPERTAMLEAIQSLKQVAEDIERCATVLGLSISLEQPSDTL